MSETGPFKRDSMGRTPLFYAAANGDIDEVKRIIFSLAGTGMCCQRLSLLCIKDSHGFSAADLADESGHKAIADLLRSEEMRMSFFE